MKKSSVSLKRVFYVIEHLNRYSTEGDKKKTNICLQELSEILDMKAEKVQQEFWDYKNKITEVQMASVKKSSKK